MIVISEFEIVCQKELYHNGIGVENLMKTTDNGIIVHSRLRPDVSHIPVSHRWNQLPRSSSFIILNM